jgi:hypothetical protein
MMTQGNRPTPSENSNKSASWSLQSKLFMVAGGLFLLVAMMRFVGGDSPSSMLTLGVVFFSLGISFMRFKGEQK